MKPFGILSLSGVLTLGLLVAAVNDAYAGAGDLDPSFGAGGQVETNFGRTVIPSAALLQPDGNTVVAAGFIGTSIAAEAIIATSNGSGIQADANFVVVGSQATIGRRGDFEAMVDRFTPNNTPDPAFNRAVFDFGAESDTVDQARAVAIQSNGQIIVGGGSNNGSTRFGSIFGLARLNPDGSLDGSFGNGGTVTTEFQGADSVLAVLIQPDGNIIAMGSVRDGSGRYDIALARYLGQ